MRRPKACDRLAAASKIHNTQSLTVTPLDSHLHLSLRSPNATFRVTLGQRSSNTNTRPLPTNTTTSLYPESRDKDRASLSYRPRFSSCVSGASIMVWPRQYRQATRSRSRRKAWREPIIPVHQSSRAWHLVQQACRRVRFAKPFRVRKLDYSTAVFRKFEISFRRTARVQRLYDRLFGRKKNRKGVEVASEDRPSAFEYADDEHSKSSLSSELPETEGKQFGDLLISLIKAERTRRECAAKVDEAKEEIKTLQGKIDLLLTTLNHISRRRKKPAGLNVGRVAGVLDDETRLEAATEAEIQVESTRRNRILTEVLGWENKMYSALRILQEGEPRLFRATSGFLANQRWDDPKCDVIAAGLRYDLRKVADCGRNPLPRVSNEASGQTLGRLVQVDAAGNFSLTPLHDAVFREDNQRERMSKFYLEMEEALTVKKTPKPGRSAAPEANARPAQAESQTGGPDLIDDTELLKQLGIAKDKLLKTYQYMIHDNRFEYAPERDTWLATYVYDPILEDTDDEGQVQDYYDREYMYEDRRANNAFRKAEAKYNNLRNMVQQRRIPTSCEPDMFGLLDHADDGFTESQGTGMMGEYKIRAAVAKRKIENWAPQAEGKVWRAPSDPSVVFEFDTPTPERQTMSQIEAEGPRYHGDLIQRWQAEMAVVREEMRPHSQKWELQKKIQLWKAKVLSQQRRLQSNWTQ